MNSFSLDAAALARRPILLTALFLALVPPIAGAQVLVAPPQNVVSLAAEASTEVVQDTLTIVLQISREGADAAVVQSQMRAALDAALNEARKAAKPGQLELRTGVFSLYPRYAYKPNAPASIVGWIGRAELLLEGRDVAAISQLAGRLGATSAAGSGPGPTVARVVFSLSREAREAVEAEVASRAIARFKQRAESYAKQFGFGSYSLREVSVGTGDVVSPASAVNLRVLRSSAVATADEAQPVEAGKALVSVTVNGSIQLSPR